MLIGSLFSYFNFDGHRCLPSLLAVADVEFVCIVLLLLRLINQLFIVYHRAYKECKQAHSDSSHDLQVNLDLFEASMKVTGKNNIKHKNKMDALKALIVKMRMTMRTHDEQKKGPAAG